MTNKVVHIRKHLSQKYAFHFQSIIIESRKKAYGLIVLNDLENDTKEVHAISEFLLKEYRNSSFETIKKVGYQLVSFLNYIVTNTEIVSLQQLELLHATLFLDSLGSNNKVSKNTVKGAEKALVKLYKFLIRMRVLPTALMDVFVEAEKDIENPFDVTYPGEKRKNNLHDIPHEYIPTILKIAQKTSPCIAFGIYLQIQGGLRRSEVVSIRLSDIKPIGINGEAGFQVSLNKGTISRFDTQNYISTVKRERTQHVYPFDLGDGKNFGMELFRNHLKQFQSSDENFALFVNPRKGISQGKAMTKTNYARYFNKVRDEFCNQLINSNDVNAMVLGQSLKTLEWSTHVCRGIFTNKRATEVDNAAQLQHDRGDRSMDSAQAYFEAQQLKKNQDSALVGQTNYLRDLSARKNSFNQNGQKQDENFVPMINVRTIQDRDTHEDSFDFIKALINRETGDN